jgi:hypothetical protein
MTMAGFEHTIPASARPQTYALDRATTGIGNSKFQFTEIRANSVTLVVGSLDSVWAEGR